MCIYFQICIGCICAIQLPCDCCRLCKIPSQLAHSNGRFLLGGIAPWLLHVLYGLSVKISCATTLDANLSFN